MSQEAEPARWAEAIPRARRPRWRALLVTARPRQWIKNLLVIAAAGAADALGRAGVAGRVALATVAFCLLSSGLYAINDVRDAPEDRTHPRKRHRPVAAGELAPHTAAAAGGGSLVAGLALCAVIRPLLALVGAAFVAITLSYTLLWRHLALLDIVAIAAGFVLRAVAGGVAAAVTLSRWFVLVVTCVAVFVAAGKRHSELQRVSLTGDARRRVLAHYSLGRLRLILAVSGAAALFAYCVWALALPDIDGVPWRPLTILPFAVCLARYRVLLAAGQGEAPEEVVLADPVLGLSGAAWLVTFALGVDAAG